MVCPPFANESESEAPKTSFGASGQQAGDSRWSDGPLISPEGEAPAVLESSHEGKIADTERGWKSVLSRISKLIITACGGPMVCRAFSPFWSEVQ